MLTARVEVRVRVSGVPETWERERNDGVALDVTKNCEQAKRLQPT